MYLYNDLIKIKSPGNLVLESETDEFITAELKIGNQYLNYLKLTL